MQKNIEGVTLTPLSIISASGGDVLHAMKSSDLGFNGFGEAYFSTVETGAIKAWKRHHEMTLNLVVPVGVIRFVIFDSRQESKNYKEFQEIIISRDDNYCRLTVPKMVWLGFEGVDEKSSILLNIADIEHQNDKVDKKDLNEIKFNWKV
jgi:dTDP-4-dehydrorhamnose 3,5-epimerase